MYCNKINGAIVIHDDGIQSNNINQGSIGSDWEFLAAGQFDRLSGEDTLWKHKTNHEVHLRLNGAQVGPGLVRYLDNQHTLFGVGDLNNDGYDELIMDYNGDLYSWDYIDYINSSPSQLLSSNPSGWDVL